MIFTPETILKPLNEITKKTNKSGIYMIYNHVTEKYYIGSAIKLSSRKNQHLNALRKNKHKNKYLQNAYNKYQNNLKFYFIEIVEDRNELITREQWWLDTYEVTNRNKGYNIMPTAGSQLGFRHSQESRRKISEIQVGKKLNEEHRRNIGNALKGEKSFWYGKKFTSEHVDNIKKGRKVWIVKEETKQKIRNTLKGRKPGINSLEALERSNMNRRIPVYQFTIDGIFIKQWNSIVDASKELNINSGNISLCAKGKRKSCGGFIWSYTREGVASE